MDQMSLEGMASAGPGTFVVQLQRATKPQLRRLCSVLREFPGDYEVMIQVLPQETHLPIFVPISVAPTKELRQAIVDAVGAAQTEIVGETSEYGDDVALAC